MSTMSIPIGERPEFWIVFPELRAKNGIFVLKSAWTGKRCAGEVERVSFDRRGPAQRDFIDFICSTN